MINPNSKYPGRVTVSANYPNGEAINRSTPDTGTPLEKEWLNDWFGFQQAVITNAGITASNTSDNIYTCQLLDGLDKIHGLGISNLNSVSITDNYTVNTLFDRLIILGTITSNKVVTLSTSGLSTGDTFYFLNNDTSIGSQYKWRLSTTSLPNGYTSAEIPRASLSRLTWNGSSWVSDRINGFINYVLVTEASSNPYLADPQTKIVKVSSTTADHIIDIDVYKMQKGSFFTIYNGGFVNIRARRIYGSLYVNVPASNTFRLQMISDTEYVHEVLPLSTF